MVSVAVGLAPSGASASPAPRDSDLRSAPSERIDAWVEERMAAHRIPGVAVAVVRGGEVVHLAGYGTADPSGLQVTPDTAFLISSASKTFTALVVRQLIHEGHLALDEPVAPHLAAITDHVPPEFEDVTVEQLLTHTGGLSMSVGLAGTVRVHDGPDALDRRVAELLAEPLAAEPGQRFEYSNAGAMLLAAVAEQATGQRFPQLLHERVFDPLGMSGSFASDADPRAAQLATGHQLWFGRWRPANLPYDPAGVAMGYIGSTASDLADFLQAQLDGAPTDVVPAKASTIAREPVVATGWDTPLESGHGLGWFVDELAGKRVISHSGSLGHFTAHLILVPEADDLGIAVLTNASAFVALGHEGQYDTSLGLARLLLDQDPRPTDPSILMTLAAPAAAWALLAAVVFDAARYLTVTFPRWWRRPQSPRTALRPRIRSLVLPATALFAIGATILAAAPLPAARHFYPDVGLALTLIAPAAFAWGAVRTALTAITLATSRTRARGGRQ